MEHTAIIGAGMAGLTAADALRRAGGRVTVFDKSRGTGGRLATRRGDHGAFDHGAPIIQGDAAFDTAMANLGAERRGAGWRGTPGMSAVVKPMVAKAEMRPACHIADVAGAQGAWVLHDNKEQAHGPFTDLIVAIPSVQAAALMPDADLSGVQMAAQWTLMTVWETLRPPATLPAFDAIYPQDRDTAVGGAIVAHASLEWSAAHLEDDAADVAAALLGHLRDACGAKDQPTHAAVHRWRYARTVVPLGAPFLRSGRGALLGGDWALGPNAGDAWLSGRAMAQALLA